MNAQTVLAQVPAQLAKTGWCQQSDIDGVGAMCFRGAIAQIVSGDPNSHDTALFRSAMSLASHVAGAEVVGWNDEKGRTEGEVVAVCVEASNVVFDVSGDLVECQFQWQVDAVTVANKVVVINDWRDSSSAVLWGSSSAVLWGSSSAVLRGSSSAVLWDSSSAVLRDSSSAVLWDSSSAVLWDSSSAVLRGSSSAVLWDSSSAVLRDSSYAALRDSSSAELRSPAAVAVWRKYDNGLWMPFMISGADPLASDGKKLHLVGLEIVEK
jgi:hypothetical protein